VPRDLLARWRADIVGDWRAALEGVDLLLLEPVADRSALRLVFRPDGTAEYGSPAPDPTEPVPPFPPRWELSDDRVLSVWLPVAPMPAYGLPDWSREQVCYDVLAITDLSLAVSNRRFDGEQVVVLRRADAEEYTRRKAAEYGRLLGATRQRADGG
jgi:hypothetical protein